MEKLNADQIADLLEEIGGRLELTGEAHYKARAYDRAAQSLRALNEPIEELVAEGRLQEIPGVGEAIEEKIETLHATGAHRTLERLRAEVPVPTSSLELLHVPGLTGPRILSLYEKLGIDSLEALKTGCENNTLANAKGFGPRLQEKLRQGINSMQENRGRRWIHYAHHRAEKLRGEIEKEHTGVTDLTPAGEVRRGCEVVGQHVFAGVSQGVQGITTYDDRWYKLYLSDADNFGVAKLLATGSEAHVRQLQSVAEMRGLSLTEDGIYRGGERLSCPREEDVYEALDLEYVEPELREGRNEVELARFGRLPCLIEEKDLRGVLHCHTTFSDGHSTLQQMAEATRKRGYEYFGVGDHSQLASYAGGLKPERVREQHALIDVLNREYEGTGFHIFKGTECDILADGSLDFDDGMLGAFDYVVASVHSRFSMGETEQTARLIRAVSNPHVTILGHMTGRLLLKRDGYRVDIEAVLRACADHGVAVEINSNPHRLDLDWRWHGRALELGCMLSINPDAHSTQELDVLKWGVLVARKGGLPPDRVINCLGLEAMTRYLADRKARRLNQAA